MSPRDSNPLNEKLPEALTTFQNKVPEAKQPIDLFQDMAFTKQATTVAKFKLDFGENSIEGQNDDEEQDAKMAFRRCGTVNLNDEQVTAHKEEMIEKMGTDGKNYKKQDTLQSHRYQIITLEEKVKFLEEKFVELSHCTLFSNSTEMKNHNQFFFENLKMKQAVKELVEPSVKKVSEVRDKLELYYTTYFKL